MTEDIIKEKLNQYVLNAVYVEKEKIRNDSLLFREGYIDSMGFILLITFLEEKFKIRINDNDLIEENFESIDTITSYLLRKLN